MSPKKSFLTQVKVLYRDRDTAWKNSWKAAVAVRSHPPVYRAFTPTHERLIVRQQTRELCDQIANAYEKTVTEAAHLKNILFVSAEISRRFKPILHNGHLRIGTAQKSVNLYLKYLWCFDEIPEPPHFPLDRIVQRSAGLPVSQQISWNKLDDIHLYLKQIQLIADRLKASQKSYPSIAMWELTEGWARART